MVNEVTMSVSACPLLLHGSICNTTVLHMVHTHLQGSIRAALQSVHVVCLPIQTYCLVHSFAALIWVVMHADQQDVRQRMNLRWGVMPFRLDFSANPEENVDTTFK